MSFTFNEKGHYYELDGKRLYGITSVLSIIAKPALIQWAANEACKYVSENLKDLSQLEDVLKEARFAHKKKKEDAADKGKDVHSLIEEVVNSALSGTMPTTHEHPQVQKFIDWAIVNNIEFIASEKKMYSREYWIGGTVDIVFKKDGKTYIGDVKTYSGIYDRTPFFQCAGYALMFKEMESIEVEGYCIIRVGKDGSFEEKWSYDVEGDTKGFLAALTLFKQLETYQK